ncbi:hypothetical protein BLOT_012105 [Blomia tropicalis]|nr:hypothetical protein BLOT_012105 [Blomia tropicalis]
MATSSSSSQQQQQSKWEQQEEEEEEEKRGNIFQSKVCRKHRDCAIQIWVMIENRAGGRL